MNLAKLRASFLGDLGCLLKILNYGLVMYYNKGAFIMSGGVSMYMRRAVLYRGRVLTFLNNLSASVGIHQRALQGGF